MASVQINLDPESACMNFISKCTSFSAMAVFIVTVCKAQKQILLDPVLKQNSEIWKPKLQKQKPRKFYEFGPFKILEIEKSDTTKKEKIKFFELRPLIGTTKSSSLQTLYRLVTAYNNDTAYINLAVFQRSVRDIPGFFSKREETSETYIDSTIIIVQPANDTTAWVIHTGSLMINAYEKGSLTYGNDEYSIEGINQFESRKELLLGPFPKGIVIKNKNLEELAALQLRPKKITWFRKDLSSNMSMAFAVCFSVLLCYLEYP